MLILAALLLLPCLISSSGDGNIHLLEEEIANALLNCQTTHRHENRQRRHDKNNYDASPRIDGNSRQEKNQYNHQRRNNSDQIDVINSTDANNNYSNGYDNYGENLINSAPRPVHGNFYKNSSNSVRNRRSDSLFSKEDYDQCLSQCVFANLQVVDTLGIPREAELWNKIQSSVTSQQSRALLKDQIRACFQELQTESEDNGCSYSNKLERCLMLRFSDRKINKNDKKQRK